MAGENRIIAFGANGSESAENPQEQAAEGTDMIGAEAIEQENWDEAWVEDDEAADAQTSRGWIAPALAAAAVAAWSALFAWALLPEFQTGIAPAEIPQLVMQWCVPVLLIGLVWLLAMRHSAREGKRFGDIARTLSTESALLEQRLTTVNRELSLAREFIAAQSRDLESLGRMAAERRMTLKFSDWH